MLNPKLEQAFKDAGCEQETIEAFKKLEGKRSENIELALIIGRNLFDLKFEGEPFIPDEKQKEDIGQQSDPVNHPSHYTQASVQLEPIDVLRYAPFDFGNALKYIIRAGHKGDALTDYQKALKYLKWVVESIRYNRKPYETFIENYGLQLNKFEVLNGLIVHVCWNSIQNLLDYVETKIKELENEH